MARVLTGDAWQDRLVETLQPREIIRMVRAVDGVLVHPTTFEPDDDCVSVVVAHPVKNDGEHGRDYGYAVAVDVYDSMDALKLHGLS